jgi:acyl-CoA synthetase (AMP-forming)/AMP-acid ligase II
MDLLMRNVLDRNGALYPNRECIVFEEHRWTWRDLEERTNRVANFLHERGVCRGDRIGVLHRNCADFIAIYFAASKLGAVFAPYNYWFRANELEYVIGDSDPRVLLFGGEFEETIVTATAGLKIPRYIRRGPGSGTIVDAGDWDEGVAAASPEDYRDPEVRGTDAFTIIYTSGTTGKPKGAVHDQHQTYLNGISFLATFDFHEEDTFLVYTPMFHVGAWDHLKPHMMIGSRVVIMEKFEEGAALRIITDERVTILLGVPAIYRMLLEQLTDDHDLSSVRVTYVGGSVAPIELLEELPKRGIGRDGFYHVYGLTESGPLSHALRPMYAVDKQGSVGRPLTLTEVKIMEPDKLVEMPRGERGEIWMRGPDNMVGYWRNPEATAAAVTDDGWLRTGDIGILDEDGFLYIVDRLKDMIISGGENVYAKEVEEALTTHDLIVEAAVIGVPHEVMEEQVVALVILSQADGITETEVIEYCRSRLAGYKVPRQVHFVDDFPRTAIGKVQKAQLRARYGSVFGELAATDG